MERKSSVGLTSPARPSHLLSKSILAAGPWGAAHQAHPPSQGQILQSVPPVHTCFRRPRGSRQSALWRQMTSSDPPLQLLVESVEKRLGHTETYAFCSAAWAVFLKSHLHDRLEAPSAPRPRAQRPRLSPANHRPGPERQQAPGCVGTWQFGGGRRIKKWMEMGRMKKLRLLTRDLK